MKRIKVLGESYQIKLVDGLMDEGIEGLCCPHQYLIKIDKSLFKNKRAYKKVLWHEIGHAFAFESGLHEFLSAQSLEMFCQTFSNFMCQLLRDRRSS